MLIRPAINEKLQFVKMKDLTSLEALLWELKNARAKKVIAAPKLVHTNFFQF